MMFRKLKIKSLEQQQREDKQLKKLDKKRTEINIAFDCAPMGSVEKGEYLLEFIRLTEERLKIKSTFADRKGLSMLKTMYKQGLVFKKWKKPNEVKE